MFITKVTSNYMHKLFIILFLSLSLFAKEEQIQYINEVSFLLGNSENGFNQNVNRSLAYELQFQYDGLDFPIRPEISFVYSQDIPLYIPTTNTHTRYATIMGGGVYDISYTKRLTPYLKAGVGYQSYSDVPSSPPSSFLLDAGGGFKLHITKRWALKFEVLGTLGKEHQNILATGGLNFSFGRKYVAPPPEKVCEKCPEAPKPIIVKERPTKEFPPQNIRFEVAKAKLTEESKTSLIATAAELNAAKNVDKDILIIGNTDNRGSRAFNATLSIRRANAVRSELVKNGVDPDRIEVEGLGEINPVADNSTEAGREKNRRVIIILKERSSS